MTNEPGYLIEWRANKTGTWAHAVITDVHEWVTTALVEDANGGPYSVEKADEMLRYCTSRNVLVRRERQGDTRCESCLHIVAELDAGIDLARHNWAVGQLSAAVELLAAVAPLGAPEHVTRE